MYNTRIVLPDLFWLGGSDRRLTLFEGAYPVPRGVSYNSFLLLDEHTVLFDTVDRAVSDNLLDGLDHLLDGRTLDYIIVHHMEPDHAATLADVLLRYPNAEVLCTAQAARMLSQFFTGDFHIRTVKEGDSLCSGAHTLRFYTAAMVHWPEVMVTYDETNKALFTADAFGTFGAPDGALWADEVDFPHDWLPDARRYYANIVGKYGPQVQSLLKKAAALDIDCFLPLHGPLWRRELGWFLDKYQKWSTYAPEDQTVAVFYASVYGHTENAAELFAARLNDNGVHGVRMYDVSVTHPSILLAEAFRCSHLAFFSTTCNMGIFPAMKVFLDELTAHNLQNRTAVVVENGSWAPAAGNLIREELKKLKNVKVLEERVTIRSSVKEEQRDSLHSLADLLCSTMTLQSAVPDGELEGPALFKLSYGLFLLSAREGEKDNGCIINTAIQLTDNPKRLVLCVNKANHTHDMLLRTGVLNLSVLSEKTPFNVFQRFGFQSGRDTDKFDGFTDTARSANGLSYLTAYANAVLSGRIVAQSDYGTHTLFVAELTEARVLSNEPSCTYSYYLSHVKPAAPLRQEGAEKKKQWVCRICGYVYEGDELPEDFICPLCKHPASDFDLVEI